MAGGTYTGTRDVIGSDGYTQTQVVYISQTLTLMGGYEAGWTARDPDSHPMVLDAEWHGRGVTVLGDLNSEIVTMTGFVVTGGDYTGLGNADGESDDVCLQLSADCGGGIYVREASLILHDSIIWDNIASRNGGDGGGIYLWETSYGPPCELHNVQVISNTAGISR